jgi:hypothetical protein
MLADCHHRGLLSTPGRVLAPFRGLEAWRSFGLGLLGALVAAAGPAGDLGGVGSGVDAELRGLELVCLVWLVCMASCQRAGDVGEEVGAACGKAGERSGGGVVLAGGEGSVGRL